MLILPPSSSSCSAQMVILDLHRMVDSSSSAEDRKKFAIFDAEGEEETHSLSAPPSDALVDYDEENKILPLSLSSAPLASADNSSSKQSKPKRKLHPRLPSLTTISQRNEDTRP